MTAAVLCGLALAVNGNTDVPKDGCYDVSGGTPSSDGGSGEFTNGGKDFEFTNPGGTQTTDWDLNAGAGVYQIPGNTSLNLCFAETEAEGAYKWEQTNADGDVLDSGTIDKKDC